MDQLLNFFEPKFFHLQNGKNNNDFMGFFQGWNEKHLAKCWACRWCSIFGSLIVNNHIFFTRFVLPNSKCQEGNKYDLVITAFSMLSSCLARSRHYLIPVTMAILLVKDPESWWLHKPVSYAFASLCHITRWTNREESSVCLPLQVHAVQTHVLASQM